jgi:hypothetical protein
MTDAMKKLREPAALAAVGYAGLSVLTALLNLLIPPSSEGVSEPFSNLAYDLASDFFSVTVAAAAAFAVYLANHSGPSVLRARLITLAALIELGVAALFGVICTLALFGSQGEPGQSKFYEFLHSIGSGAVVAVAGWYVWLTWQQHAAVRPAPATWQGGPGYPPQPGQMPGQQVPPPGGFGWTPQQQPGAPGQGGGPVVPPSQFGAERTQLLPPVPGGPVVQRPALDGSQSQIVTQQPGVTQSQPPIVPPTMQGYAAQPDPWSPGGPAQQQQPQQPPAPPVSPDQQFPQQQPAQQPGQQPPANPFSVGDWRSE